MTSNPGLKRSLGLFSACMAVIGAMIGSGVFKKIAPMSNGLGSPVWVLICWGLAGFITLMGSLTNAEIAGIIAEPGGQYVYFKKMYGRLFAYMYGWASFSVIQTATAVSVAYVFAQSLTGLCGPIIPDLPAEWVGMGVGSFTPFANFGVKCLTALLVIVLSIINYRGIQYGSFISNVFGSSIIVAIVVILVSCLFFSNGKLSNITTDAIIPAKNGVASTGNMSVTISSIFTAMLAAFWAYEGWNNLSFLGGEIKDPKRNIPLAFTFATAFVMLVYMLINFGFSFVLPVSDFIAMNDHENMIPAVEVMKNVMGYGGGVFISSLILMTTFNSSNNSIMSAPRIYYAMANDGLFFKSCASVHPRFQTPHKAIVLQCIWGVVLTFSGSFDMLTELLVMVAFIFYGAGAFGVFILRKTMKDEPRTYKVIGYPIVPALFVLFAAGLVINTIITNPLQSFFGLGLVALGLPLYWYMNRHKT